MGLNQLATAVTAKIANEIPLDNTQKAAVQYGFEILAGIVINFCVILSSGAILGFGRTALIILVGTYFLKAFFGGAHCRSFCRCLFTGTVIILSCSYLTEQIRQTVAPVILIKFGLALFPFLLIAVAKYAPVEAPEKPLSPRQQQVLKQMALLLTAALAIRFCITLRGNPPDGIRFLFPVFVSMLLQTANITPLGCRLIGWVDAFELLLWQKLTSKQKGGAQHETV